jgi:hypothetical protein
MRLMQAASTSSIDDMARHAHTAARSAGATAWALNAAHAVATVSAPSGAMWIRGESALVLVGDLEWKERIEASFCALVVEVLKWAVMRAR